MVMKTQLVLSYTNLEPHQRLGIRNLTSIDFLEEKFFVKSQVSNKYQMSCSKMQPPFKNT